MVNWQKSCAILNGLDILGEKLGDVGQILRGYLGECLAVLIQFEMDESILQDKGKTCGFIDDAFFRLLNSLWETCTQDPERKIENVLPGQIREVAKGTPVKEADRMAEEVKDNVSLETGCQHCAIHIDPADISDNQDPAKRNAPDAW